MFEFRRAIPYFWVHVAVFILSVVAAIFLICNNQPIRVDTDDLKRNKLQVEERKE